MALDFEALLQFQNTQNTLKYSKKRFWMYLGVEFHYLYIHKRNDIFFK